jgi:hypothetical protein
MRIKILLNFIHIIYAKQLDKIILTNKFYRFFNQGNKNENHKAIWDH